MTAAGSLQFLEQVGASVDPADDPTLRRFFFNTTTGKLSFKDFAGAITEVGGTGGGDADAIHDNVAGEIAAVTEKLAPVAADLLLIEDSAAANAKKRVQSGNLAQLIADLISKRTVINDEAGAITVGQLVYVSGQGATTEVKLALATSAATARFDGLVADASIASAASGKILLDGISTVIPTALLDGGGPWPAGALVYVSPTTAGNYTSTIPSAVGEWVVKVGRVHEDLGGTGVVHIQRGEPREIT
jgi:hypothetical protein